MAQWTSNLAIEEHSWPTEGLGQNGSITSIVVHHAASADAGDISAEQINRSHINSNGWTCIGYHYVIRKNGKIEQGRPEQYIGAHTLGQNDRRIGICVTGHCSIQEPTDKQLQSLSALMKDIADRHGFDLQWQKTVFGHQDFMSTDCPGQYLYAKLPSLISSASSGNSSVKNIDTTLWSTFAEKIKEAIELKIPGLPTINPENMKLFPKVCYLYVQLGQNIQESSFSNTEWGFPYTDEQIRTFVGKCVYLTDTYRARSGKHEGIDMQPGGTADNGLINGQKVPFRACKDGIVKDDGTLYDSYNHAIYVAHNDGTWSRYMHGIPAVSLNQHVKKGDVLGYTWNYTSTGAYHLHLEFGKQNGNAPYEKINNDESLGLNPLDFLKQPNFNDGGYRAWRVT